MGHPARLPRKLFRFLRVSSRERRDLLAALGALLWARRAMRDRATGDLVALHEGQDATAPVDLPRARALARAVVRVAAYLPFDASCLIRSLAIQRLFAREGMPPGQIRIGVRIDEVEGFQAHAWVEVEGRVVGDVPQHVSTFTPVTDMTAIRF
ncbi:MAG: lasso peptide biosynthesis B2 protein [Gemmatimonadota bacterium]|nr:lasso peptide biosynthesis B2 protein [Gemmatimonadota bacterium]